MGFLDTFYQDKLPSRAMTVYLYLRERSNKDSTFRLGNLWGILLDCGEDKNDDRPEYGGTICCHAFFGCGILWENGTVRVIFNGQETVTEDTVL